MVEAKKDTDKPKASKKAQASDAMSSDSDFVSLGQTKKPASFNDKLLTAKLSDDSDVAPTR